jgi:protein gp37
MADQKDGIAYLDETWNPLAMRCDRVSAGCRFCWHLRMAARMACNHILCPQARAAYAGGDPWLDETRLMTPRHWRKPRRVGVQFMGDLWHSRVTDEQINRVFAVMALCPQHTFIVLTKRPERMRDWINSDHSDGLGGYAFSHPIKYGLPSNDVRRVVGVNRWPLPNVWLGTSVEDQQTAEERIPHLLATPAAVRFLSMEPLLGPVQLTGDGTEYLPDEYCSPSDPPDRIDWVICGGESGPGARPMDPAWARSLRDQCATTRVPFFFKQMSGKAPIPADLMIRQTPEARR